MLKITIILGALFMGLVLYTEKNPGIARYPTRQVTKTDNYANELAAADNVLRATLFDYGSARIKWDYELKGGKLTVRVNAKNQFGGYTGFKTYTFRHGIIQ